MEGVERVRSALLRHGGRGIRGPDFADRIATTLRYHSAEDACGAAFAGGPVALAYSRFDGATRSEAHAE